MIVISGVPEDWLDRAAGDATLPLTAQATLMRIYAAMKDSAPVSLLELSRRTGLDRIRLRDNVALLVDRGLVVASGINSVSKSDRRAAAQNVAGGNTPVATGNTSDDRQNVAGGNTIVATGNTPVAASNSENAAGGNTPVAGSDNPVATGNTNAAGGNIFEGFEEEASLSPPVPPLSLLPAPPLVPPSPPAPPLPPYNPPTPFLPDPPSTPPLSRPIAAIASAPADGIQLDLIAKPGPARGISSKRNNRVALAEESFSRFWDAWVAPARKVAIKHAKPAFVRAVVGGVDPEEIITAAYRYVASERAKGTQSGFVKHPATWLNAGCWADDVPEPEDTSPERMRRLAAVEQAMLDTEHNPGGGLSWQARALLNLGRINAAISGRELPPEGVAEVEAIRADLDRAKTRGVKIPSFRALNGADVTVIQRQPVPDAFRAALAAALQGAQQ